jgi:rhodanese-related sulfurtransferase
VATVQGTLALDLDRLPAPAPAAPDLRVVPGGGPVEHPELQLWTTRFAQATVEVLAGGRPLQQLLRWTSARVYQDLERRVRILAQTAPTPPRGRTLRPQVRSVHVFRPGPHSAEVSVHVRHGHRSRAMAARLEERDGSWRCVALQLG